MMLVRLVLFVAVAASAWSAVQAASLRREKRQQEAISFMPEVAEEDDRLCGREKFAGAWAATIDISPSVHFARVTPVPCRAYLISPDLLVGSLDYCRAFYRHDTPLTANFVVGEELSLEVAEARSFQDSLAVFRLKQPLQFSHTPGLVPVCLADSEQLGQKLEQVKCEAQDGGRFICENGPEIGSNCDAQAVVLPIEGLGLSLLGVRSGPCEDEATESVFINIPSLHTLLEGSQEAPSPPAVAAEASSSSSSPSTSILTFPDEEEEGGGEEESGQCPLIEVCDANYSCSCPPSAAGCALDTPCPVKRAAGCDANEAAGQSMRASEVCPGLAAEALSSRIVTSGLLPKATSDDEEVRFDSSSESGPPATAPPPATVAATHFETSKDDDDDDEDDFQFSADPGAASAAPTSPAAPSGTFSSGSGLGEEEGDAEEKKAAAAPSISQAPASSSSSPSPDVRASLQRLPACNGNSKDVPCSIPHGRCSEQQPGKRCECQQGFHWNEHAARCESKDCVGTGDEQRPCIFPFSYEGELRYECVQFPDDNKFNITHNAFCPVEVDPVTLEVSDSSQWQECSESCDLRKYHTHEELLRDLKRLAEDYPDHAELFNVGLSRQGRELRGIRITKNLARNGAHSEMHLSFRPKVKLVGNMHGNEPVGRELLIHLAKYLLERTTAEATPGHREGAKRTLERRAKKILETTGKFLLDDLYILPTMNPDGFARGQEGKCSGGSYSAGRLNEGRKDLNRNFPDWRELRQRQGDPGYDLFAGRELETQHLMRWILEGHFTLSANFHDGAVLVNYPYDNYHDSSQESGAFPTPDHDEFFAISTAYSFNHRTMNDTEKVCPYWGSFDRGVTNGAEWYPVEGGMQDFNYLFANTLEVTVEVSCCKFPPRWRLLWEWENNKGSIISFIEQAQRGIKGRVTDITGDPVKGAQIQVRKKGSAEWRRTVVTTNSRGIYWRILQPGEYEIRAIEPGLDQDSEISEVSVDEQLRPRIVDLTLRPRRLSARQRHRQQQQRQQRPEEPQIRSSNQQPGEEEDSSSDDVDFAALIFS